jgi:hypothetical protein
VLRLVGVYTLLVILFRVAGKRGLANLNTFDFVVIFLLSNIVQNAIIGNDNRLLGRPSSWRGRVQLRCPGSDDIPPLRCLPGRLS